MDKFTLAELERAIEPYRQEGFTITSQSEGAITLSPPPERLSYLVFFITLVLFWPVAVIYLVSFNSHKNRQVCVRLTSQGRIEETGYTLEALARDRGRGQRLILIAVGIPVAMVLALLLLRFRLW
ncbi:MAG: hypothetical protein M3362_00870 [Acidobacteriota bacterium]|nr:hypothetical protein [Acidobacteriota bacterium]